MYIDLSKMNSGFCDRLRQITFCIAYNKILKKKIRKIEIFEIKVPLSDYRRVITLLLEKARHRGPILGNQTGREPLNDSGLQLGTPTIATGQKTVPGGRAYR